MPSNMDSDPPSLPPDLRLPDDESARDYERLWALLSRTEDAHAASYDVDAAWGELADRLDLDASSPAPGTDDRAPRRPAPDNQHSPRGRYAWGTVAALLVLALSVGLWWSTRPVSVATAAGEQRTVTLPDGSTAELNGATTLTYPEDFSTLPWTDADARRVTLEGEAFFSVTDRERPFSVETPNARVDVLGTTFSVQAAAEETQVALASGRVRIRSTSGTDPDRSVALTESGEMSRVVGATPPTPPQTIDLRYVQAWRQGGFAISDAALPDVLRALERRFGATLQLGVPVADTDTMTLHYASDVQLEPVLRDICVIQGLQYRETSQGYELIRK